MLPRIAIPVPHSEDLEYAGRALPQYVHAVQMAGGEPVCIPLNLSAAEITTLIEDCSGVVLPGSKADVDPAKYGSPKHLKTAAADFRRDTADEMLLRNAYAKRKPVLGICYGLQSLNVYRGGTLRQHIESPVNHEAGKNVPIAHTADIKSDSRLGRILVSVPHTSGDEFSIPVNSSHHQSAEVPGRGLRFVARCPDDGIIEALEGIAADHFVVAVQWHPERSVENDEHSRALFRALIKAAELKPPEAVVDSTTG
jgi:putative glutamine amidotransferase